MNSDGEKISFNIFILAELLNSLCTAKVIVKCITLHIQFYQLGIFNVS